MVKHIKIHRIARNTIEIAFDDMNFVVSINAAFVMVKEIIKIYLEYKTEKAIEKAAAN